MARETAPAFQFYVKEWRSSRKVARMAFAVRGMYLEMLLEQWENLTLPDDPGECADLIGGTVEEWTAAWPELRRNFVEAGPGRIKNARLERARAEMRKYKTQQRNAANTRWEKERARKVLETQDVAHMRRTESADAAHMQRTSTAPDRQWSASASASASATATAGTGEPPPPDSEPETQKPPEDVKPPDPPKRGEDTLPSGRKLKAPLREYTRLTIWPWQLDELVKILGTDGAIAFNVLGWLKDLDEHETAVLDYKTPTEFFHGYLKPKLLDEVKRRGLRLASQVSSAATVGSQPPADCRHTPRCRDDAEHTRKALAERRANPTPLRRVQ